MKTVRYFLWITIAILASLVGLLAQQGAFYVDASKTAFGFYQNINTTFQNQAISLADKKSMFLSILDKRAERYNNNPRIKALIDKAKTETKNTDNLLAYIKGLTDTLSAGFTNRQKLTDTSALHSKYPTKQLFVQQHHADTLMKKLAQSGYLSNYLSQLTNTNYGFDGQKYPNGIYYLLDGANVQTTLAFLQQLKVDVLLKEIESLESYELQAKGSAVLYDKFWVSVIPNRTNLQLGDTLHCSIYLAVSSSMAHPNISVNGKTLPLDDKGVATYKQVCTHKGDFSISGSIRLPDTIGEQKTYPFVQKYSVKNVCP